MEGVVNLRDCELDDRPDFPPPFVHHRARTHGELIGCSVYEIPPGKRAWPYHGHHNNEEWAVVVDGTPTLRTVEGERELRAGDLVAFPEGEAGEHDFSNRSDTPVRVAIFSTLRQGNAYYPDSDKVGLRGRYYRRRDAVDYWYGE